MAKPRSHSKSKVTSLIKMDLIKDVPGRKPIMRIANPQQKTYEGTSPRWYYYLGQGSQVMGIVLFALEISMKSFVAAIGPVLIAPILSLFASGLIEKGVQKDKVRLKKERSDIYENIKEFRQELGLKNMSEKEILKYHTNNVKKVSKVLTATNLVLSAAVAILSFTGAPILFPLIVATIGFYVTFMEYNTKEVSIKTDRRFLENERQIYASQLLAEGKVELANSALRENEVNYGNESKLDNKWVDHVGTSSERRVAVNNIQNRY